MNKNNTISPFHFIGHRVTKLIFDNKPFSGNSKLKDSLKLDYEVAPIDNLDGTLFGSILLKIDYKVKSDNKPVMKALFEIEGTFSCIEELIPIEQFADMVELNGLITLMHISRSILLGASSISGIQPPIMIPMINVKNLQAIKRQNKD